MSSGKAITGAAPAQALDKLVRVNGEVVRQHKTRLPTRVYFPLVVVLSLTITSLGYSFLNDRTRGELATIARPLTNSEVAVLVGWRIAELSLGWWANYDSVDLAALSLLSHGPTVYLLTTFYNIRPGTAAAALFIDALSSFLPYQLLRPLSSAHARSPAVPNREIVTDPSILAYNGVLSALIYSITLFASLKTILPTSLVLYFTGIRSIQPATDATLLYPPALLLAIVFGIATPLFIFTPAAAVDRTATEPDFNPAEATLAETVRWNLLGYSAPTKVGVSRTGVLAAVTWISTYLQLALTVHGVESPGAATYASVWATAAVLAGVGLQFVGSA